MHCAKGPAYKCLFRIGGPPAEGPRGGRAPAEGPGGGIHWGGDTPKDYTKPRQTIQSPGILDKAPETLYKCFEYWTKTQNIKQKLTISNKNPKH